MASPFPAVRAPPLPRQLKGGSKRARILCRRQPQCPHPAALRFCRAFRGGFAAAPPSTRLPRRLSILSIQPPRRLALLPARWACAFAAGKRLPTFRGGGFASSALSVHLPRRLGILSAQLPRRLALLPARWRLCLRRHQTPSRLFAAAALLLPRFPCIYRGVWASFPHSHLDAWRSFPRDGACAFAAIKRPPAFSRRRLRFFRAFRASTAALGHPFHTATSTLGAPSRAMGLCLRRRQTPSYLSRRRLRRFRAFPFRRASLLPLSLSPRLLALRSPAVFPASKSRKNSGRGIDRARWRASVTGSIWLSIPRPAASKAVRGGAYRPARRRP